MKLYSVSVYDIPERRPIYQWFAHSMAVARQLRQAAIDIGNFDADSVEIEEEKMVASVSDVQKVKTFLADVYDEGDDDPAAKAENAIYAAQVKLITKKYGKKAADKANYGWGVAGDDDYVSVSTKVYGHGVLTSTADARDGWKITHEWTT